jgi:periplasmic protein TonB
MFEDSLVESNGRLAPRHSWATVVSFGVQIAICGSLLLLSLIYTEALPTQRWINMLQAPPPPPASQTPLREATSPSNGIVSQSAIVVPRGLPTSISNIQDEKPGAGRTDGMVGDIPGGFTGGSSYDISTLLRNVAPVAPKLAAPSKLRVSSGVAHGMLIHRVSPEYPQVARVARVEGRVILQATIGKDGSVQNLRLVSGHPLLVQAAIDAVKQWLYKPYYLSGEPVEADTTIIVNFTLTP